MRRLPLLLWLLFFFLLLCSHPTVDAAVFDGLPRRAGAAPLPDGALQALIEQSIAWLEFRAEYSTYPQLKDLADALQSFLRPCPHCIDYFEALGLLRRLGRAVKRVIDDGKNDVHYPVVRRAYIAAVWLLQRSRMFKWELTHLQANALSIMYRWSWKRPARMAAAASACSSCSSRHGRRSAVATLRARHHQSCCCLLLCLLLRRLYVQHVSRAKGRPISFHHISKCGGTTMCQLAAANKCSNPHMNIEKNCVLSDKCGARMAVVLCSGTTACRQQQHEERAPAAATASAITHHRALARACMRAPAPAPAPQAGQPHLDDRPRRHARRRGAQRQHRRRRRHRAAQRHAAAAGALRPRAAPAHVAYVRMPIQPARPALHLRRARGAGGRVGHQVSRKRADTVDRV